MLVLQLGWLVSSRTFLLIDVFNTSEGVLALRFLDCRRIHNNSWKTSKGLSVWDLEAFNKIVQGISSNWIKIALREGFFIWPRRYTYLMALYSFVLFQLLFTGCSLVAFFTMICWCRWRWDIRRLRYLTSCCQAEKLQTNLDVSHKIGLIWKLQRHRHWQRQNKSNMIVSRIAECQGTCIK